VLSRCFIALWIACQATAATAFDGGRAPGSGLHQRCVASPQRAMELEAGARLQRDRTLQARTAEVPAHLHEAFRRLLKVARLPAGVRPELLGVHSPRSAFVLASGTVVVSSRLWTGEGALQGDEAAAAIAHELAHLELGHQKDRLCEALAATGDEGIALAGATGAAHRAVRAGDDALAVRLMRGNHLRELEADRRGAELLRLAGIAPDAMGRMLLKMARADGRGHSGSHPALETRLENLGLVVGIAR